MASYGESDLLAAAQCLLVLATVALFGDLDEPALQHPLDARLLIDLWDVKERLAKTGLFLEAEHNCALPQWKEWCLVEAKRRTILSINHVEWCWSLLHGCPVLTCFELGPLPAPSAGHLWRASDETTWQRLYRDYTWQWKDGTYKMTEFWYLDPSGRLDARTEQWLSSADEFGMMLMAEGKWSTAVKRQIHTDHTSSECCWICLTWFLLNQAIGPKASSQSLGRTQYVRIKCYTSRYDLFVHIF